MSNFRVPRMSNFQNRVFSRPSLILRNRSFHICIFFWSSSKVSILQKSHRKNHNFDLFHDPEGEQILPDYNEFIRICSPSGSWNRSKSWFFLPFVRSIETFDELQKNIHMWKERFLRTRDKKLGGFSCLPVNYYQTKGGRGDLKFFLETLRVALSTNICKFAYLAIINLRGALKITLIEDPLKRTSRTTWSFAICKL